MKVKQLEAPEVITSFDTEFSTTKPLDLERKQYEVDHPVLHEDAQKHSLGLLLHSQGQFDHLHYDIHEAYQHKEAPPKSHCHI